MFDGVDSSFAEAIKSYVTTNDRKAMSEAQFYAVKKIAEVFGYNISYDAETGFDIAV
jgi:hypothetical protein